MKAVLLAGGNGSRLFPIAAGGSKAGASLLGRPVVSWSAERLRDAGVEELMITMTTGMEPIPAEGLCLPVTIRWETQPLGTVGSLLGCAEWCGEEAFLLLCGDVIWDFDLDPLLEAHRNRGGVVTLALCQNDMPQRYGVAVTDERGNVVRFTEKPAPEQCEAKTVFTGIAVCSKELFRWCREEDQDLSRDLLPRLAEAGVLRSVGIEGYWRDIGTPEDYLQATADLMSGKCVHIPGIEPQTAGIWVESKLPEDVELVPPCRIGANVTIGPGSLIGPHVSLEDGVTIGAHSLIQRSVLLRGAQVGSRATVYGAVVCRGARVGHYAVLNEGAVVGSGATVGDNAILMEQVRIWPELTVPSSIRLTASLTVPMTPPPSEQEPGLSVEDMVELGRRLGRCGAVGVGGVGLEGLVLARALACGVVAQGGQVLFHDGTDTETAMWLAGYYGWPASAFVAENGALYLFDEQGNRLERLPADSQESMGGIWDTLVGCGEAYRAAKTRGQADEPAQPRACAAFTEKNGLYFL